MNNLELLIDFHKDSERQGPGSESETLKALHLTNLDLAKELKVADMGCGTGAQTMTLAKHLKGQITAIDLFPAFLDKLVENAHQLNLSDRIHPLIKSIDDLDFEEEELDLIWSEGAIYNIGFENGIKNWKKYLKPGGYLAVSEITWISNDWPKEINDFWQEAYPEIARASEKIRLLETNGYSLAGYFYLDPDSWITNYYQPMEARFEPFLERNKHSEAAKSIIEEHKAEIASYLKYKDYYSYGFYVAQKR